MTLITWNEFGAVWSHAWSHTSYVIAWVIAAAALFTYLANHQTWANRSRDTIKAVGLYAMLLIALPRVTFISSRFESLTVQLAVGQIILGVVLGTWLAFFVEMTHVKVAKAGLWILINKLAKTVEIESMKRATGRFDESELLLLSLKMKELRAQKESQPEREVPNFDDMIRKYREKYTKGEQNVKKT